VSNERRWVEAWARTCKAFRELAKEAVSYSSPAVTVFINKVEELIVLHGDPNVPTPASDVEKP
jgi:hypothetical protein